MNRTAVRPTSTNPASTNLTSKGNDTMFMEEALARSRMREAQQAARDHRRAREFTAGRNWQWLSRWSARRAASARSEF